MITLISKDTIIFNLGNPESEMQLVRAFELKALPRGCVLNLGNIVIKVSEIESLIYSKGLSASNASEQKIIDLLPEQYKDNGLALHFMHDIKSKVGYIPSGDILNVFLAKIVNKPNDPYFYKISLNNCCNAVTGS